MNPLRLATTSIRDVTFSTPLSRAASATLAAVVLLQTTGAVTAAPAAKTAPSSALSFNVTASIGYAAPGETPLPPQTVAAKVLIHGNKARVETAAGGQPSVVLFTPPYVYRLLPKAKAGVRWKVDPARNQNFGQFSPQDLLRDPSRIRAALLQSGGRKVKTGTINGAPAEIYEIKNFRGQKGQTARAWLRKADALPLRLEVSGGNLQVRAAWTNYRRIANVSATSFVTPQGYKVRQVQGQPPFSS